MGLRSISLPSRLDTTSLKVEEDLNKLKSLELEQQQCLSSLEARIVALAELYVSFTDLIIRTSSTQQALFSSNHLFLQETLDISDSLINTCSSSRDLVSSLKDHVRDLHSALRRGSGVGCHVAAYVGLRKKSKKEAAKCAKELKQMEHRSVDDDGGDVIIRGLLREVACVSIGTLRSLLSFLSGESRSGGGRWALVSRVLVAKRPARGSRGEVAGVDHALWSMQSGKDDVDSEEVKRRLSALDCGSQSLENALDLLFRSFVQNRVSLLNILTNH